MNISWDKSDSFKKLAIFYDSLFKKDLNSFKDFNDYLVYQKDKKIMDLKWMNLIIN